ncbi:hypothetical protein SAMN04487910_0302 [Aquimarina amphilecti]|uniref:Uncharacterized protein n=1 Tax=Aquimarina amphilecti TaxID=1038014 RepID=A0A1H7G881_AQUAM|nr:hypothetical protein [Aquimarina amphilecti]SEK34341.1 hypothetical protein SAMN04487910_0302 [Aquimarina amphilecti]
MNNQITLKESPNRQTHALRLSRMKDELTVMLSDLHSYRCEPCTPDMHKQFLELDFNGRKLSQTINNAFDLLKNSVQFSKEIGDEVFEVIKKYHQFQKKVSSYRSEAIVHH